jgi:O-antigen/teichoic acid export membrane protein
MAVAFMWIAGAPLLAALLHSPSSLPYIVVGAGMPAFLAQAVERGLLQGQQRFGSMIAALSTEACSRLGLGILFVALGLGVDGAALGLALSFVVGWAVAHRALGPVPAETVLHESISSDLKRARTPVTLLTLAEIIASYGDLVVVRHCFSPHAAGVYATVSLAGRAVFFASQPIGQIVFPIAARQAAAGGLDRRLLGRYLAGVTIVGGTLLAALTAGGRPLIMLVFGARYGSAAALTPAYGLASMLLAVGLGASLLEVAAARRGGPALALMASLVQFASLCLLHSTLGEVVAVQIAVMSAFALAAVAAARTAQHVRPPAPGFATLLTREPAALKASPA